MNQTDHCPYCGYIDEECYWNYELDSEEEKRCDRCKRDYISKPQYLIEGWIIEKQCQECGEWSDDEMMLCDCEDRSELNE